MTRERFGRVPESILEDADLSDWGFRVFAAIALHADKHGAAYPGQELLAEIMGATRWRVRKGIEELRKWGHIEVAPTIKARGGQGSNRYFLPALAESLYDDRQRWVESLTETASALVDSSGDADSAVAVVTYNDRHEQTRFNKPGPTNQRTEKARPRQVQEPCTRPPCSAGVLDSKGVCSVCGKTGSKKKNVAGAVAPANEEVPR